jgi:hypothetical protein
MLKVIVPVNRCINGICTGSHKVTSLKMYKFIVVEKSQKADCVATGRFCSWFCEAEYSDDVYPLLTYFTDEKLFY